MDMQKPYDKAALLAELKKQGIEEGEKAVKIVVGVTADWLRSSAKLSTDGIIGKLDDFAIPGVNYVEKLINEKLDALEAELAPAAAAGAPAQPAPSEPSSS